MPNGDEPEASSASNAFGHHRLPGPTWRENEQQAAEYVADSLAVYEGRILGPRTRHDATSGLRVDFTFDQAEPPVAMEITALVEPDVRALNSELLKLEAQLQEIVAAEELGEWLLSIWVGADVRRLRPLLIEFLCSQKERHGVARFDRERAPDDLSPRDLALLARLLDIGLLGAMRNDTKHALSILPPAGDVSSERGFGTLLRHAVEDNASKLEEARPRETHLVVWEARSGLSADPALTPPPPLPDAVDVLWVMLGYYTAKWTYRLWKTSRGDGRWQLLNHPLGEPPTTHPLPTSGDGPPEEPGVN
jgi:hypothetical protein